MELVLSRLAEHKLFILHSKCSFGAPTIEFLGSIISASGVLPDPSKVESISLWPVPMSVHDILVFLGMAVYYSYFVQKYTDKAAALTDLLKERTKCKWSAAAQESFELLKNILSTAPILLYPRFDLPFVYSTDVLSVAVGATLLQNLG